MVTLPAALLVVDVAFFSGFRRVHLYVVGAVAAVLVARRDWSTPDASSVPARRHRPREASPALSALLTQSARDLALLGPLAWPAAERLQIDYHVVTSHSLLDPITTLWVYHAGSDSCLQWPFGSSAADRGCPRRGCSSCWHCRSSLRCVILLEMVFEHRLVPAAATLLIGGVVASARKPDPARRRSERLLIPVLVVAGLLCWPDHGPQPPVAGPGRPVGHRTCERGASPSARR
ncbi:MAG: hypothetical protein U5K43_05050 [Halofilum sp. (in: g-proteobacteria)]|nr:hypothetical protein [Halofilum sp. (in: g-proteobacteria)]